jgi:hypothetical protein
MVEEMTKLVLEATAWEGEDAGIRVWVLVHEVPDGFWGAGGQIIRFEQLRAAAKAERERSLASASHSEEGGDGAAAVEGADKAPA